MHEKVYMDTYLLKPRNQRCLSSITMFLQYQIEQDLNT